MPPRILLIDDKRIVLKGIKDTLRRKSGSYLEIDTAFNFRQAKRYLSQSEYDVICLDLNMPSIKDEPCFDTLSGTTLNGWLFLENFIFDDESIFQQKCLNTKIIIFSGYINELTQHIKQVSPTNKKQGDWFSKVQPIHKGCGEYDTIADTIISSLE